jgi:hypothetical protein
VGCFLAWHFFFSHSVLPNQNGCIQKAIKVTFWYTTLIIEADFFKTSMNIQMLYLF